ETCTILKLSKSAAHAQIHSRCCFVTTSLNWARCRVLPMVRERPDARSSGAAMPSFDQTPDTPQSFGYKVSWFAVKAADSPSVLGALRCTEGTPANWASGLKAAGALDRAGPDAWVFASPSIDGRVLLVGYWLPHPEPGDIGRKFDVLFSRLME